MEYSKPEFFLYCAISHESVPHLNIAKAKIIGPGGLWWFYKQVKTKGNWDYKQSGYEYEDFGNFHFGAVGRALGFSDQVLLRGAGAYQVYENKSEPEWGNPLGSSPYGDDPRDQEMIRRGSEYYQSEYMQ
jgi:hypothetical protein